MPRRPRGASDRRDPERRSGTVEVEQVGSRRKHTCFRLCVVFGLRKQTFHPDAVPSSVGHFVAVLFEEEASGWLAVSLLAAHCHSPPGSMLASVPSSKRPEPVRRLNFIPAFAVATPVLVGPIWAAASGRAKLTTAAFAQR